MIWLCLLLIRAFPFSLNEPNRNTDMCATKLRENSKDAAASPKRARRAAPRSAAPAAEAAAIAQLDRIDRAILKHLQRDASISNVALAEKVRLSAPACLRRVERLKSLGLIRRVVALLEPKAVGAGMLVVIGIVLDRSTPEAFAAFEQAARHVSGCMECHVVTGEFDYFMLVRTRDSESFNRLHAEQLLYLPGVRQVRSFMVLKEILSTTEFPIA
jgi:DNA-binding Lrp family transcriptional regulator